MYTILVHLFKQGLSLCGTRTVVVKNMFMNAKWFVISIMPISNFVLFHFCPSSIIGLACYHHHVSLYTLRMLLHAQKTYRFNCHFHLRNMICIYLVWPLLPLLSKRFRVVKFALEYIVRRWIMCFFSTALHLVSVQCIIWWCQYMHHLVSVPCIIWCCLVHI